ncbi:MAG: lytic murein transglycosylase, partial [Alphaproteobacteria bacterium]
MITLARYLSRVIETALADVEPVARILEQDRKQAEFTITRDKYRARGITPENVRVGLAKRQKHAELLDAVAKRDGVQPRFILA